jgi:hypothetical protein
MKSGWQRKIAFDHAHYQLYQPRWIELPAVIAHLHLQKLPFSASGTIFRGQSDASWLLQSRWERQFSIVQKAGLGEYYRLQPREPMRVQLQSTYLDQFRTLLEMHCPELGGQSDDGLWAFGQHHGLVTPLLDWTSDYRIAAFFAFRELTISPSRRAQDSPVAIWAIHLAYGLPHASVWSDDRFPRVETLCFESVTQSLRQQAQRGIFTRLSHPIFGDVGAYLDNVHPWQSGPLPFLVKIELPAKDAKAAIKDLARDGITEAALFPAEQSHEGLTERNERLRRIIETCNRALLALPRPLSAPVRSR